MDRYRFRRHHDATVRYSWEKRKQGFRYEIKLKPSTVQLAFGRADFLFSSNLVSFVFVGIFDIC